MHGHVIVIFSFDDIFLFVIVSDDEFDTQKVGGKDMIIYVELFYYPVIYTNYVLMVRYIIDHQSNKHLC